MNTFVRKVFAAVLLGLCGCSVISDFNECESNNDCFGNVCVDGVCETPACDTPASCEKYGEDFRCIQGGCIALSDDRCSTPFDDDIEDEVYHFGGLFPLTGRNGAKGDATSRGAFVALNQLNLSSNGIDGTRLSLVLCDTENNENTAVEVAEYMTETLGIKAFIGSISSGETLDVAREVTIDADAILVSPASTSPQLSSLDDDDLVWRTIASDSLQGPALAALVRSKMFTNMIVMTADTPYGQGLFDAFLNAKDASGNQFLSADDFELIQYQTDENGEAIAGSFSDKVGELLENTDPDAFVILGSVESQQIIFSLETTYFQSNPDVSPTWVLSEAGRDVNLLEDSNFDNIRERIIGTIIRQNDTQAYENFKTRFSAEHSLNASDHPFADKAYDAAFTLSLALAASEKMFEADGNDLAEFFLKMADGPEFSPGDEIGSVISNLKRDGANYEGASGPVDFDPETGDVTSEIVEWGISNREFEDRGLLIDATGTPVVE